MSNLALFTYEEGNLLIRILIAHVLADFLIQTDGMVKNKSWWSLSMLYHMLSVCICTFALTFDIKLALLITSAHYFIDGLKVSALRKWSTKEGLLFGADQLLHCLAIIFIWAACLNKVSDAITEATLLIHDYKISVVLLGYAICIWPAAYVVRFAVKQLDKNSQPSGDQLEHGGRWIGQFERIIILSLVLLNQYEAIGFLITGKSIIRFADRGGEVKSEYVLVGTLLSYAIAILTGILINWLLYTVGN